MMCNNKFRTTNMFLAFLIPSFMLYSGSSEAEVLKCYHCTTLGFNGTWFHDPHCDDPSLIQDSLIGCGQNFTWPWPEDVLQPSTNSTHDIGNATLGMDYSIPNKNVDKLEEGEGIELVCVKITAVLGEQLHTMRGCMMALLKDMVNRCENVDYDYETVGGVILRNMRMCFCNEEACNSARSLFLNPKIGFGIVVAIVATSLKNLI